SRAIHLADRQQRPRPARGSGALQPRGAAGREGEAPFGRARLMPSLGESGSAGASPSRSRRPPANPTKNKGGCMPAPKRLLAFDLGAESGRGVLGLFDGQRLSLEVVHRFPNGPVRTLDTLHWDVLRLHGEMAAALRKCAGGDGIDALGVDTWGVDFALLGRGGTLLGNPRHYRDPHTETAMEEAFARVPAPEVFRQTGVQFMRFNTLFQ